MLPYLIMGSSLVSGLAKRKSAYESSGTERRNAISGLTSARLTERGMKLQQESLLSKIRGTAGAAGVDVTQGSAMQAYLQAARETELEIVLAHKAADADFAGGMRGAKNLKRAGDFSLFGDLLGGAALAKSYGTKKDKATFKA